jgi:hypothetical protein
MPGLPKNEIILDFVIVVKFNVELPTSKRHMSNQKYFILVIPMHQHKNSLASLKAHANLPKIAL